jgi:hypothetical protein
MFNSNIFRKKIALVMGNSLLSCKEDVTRIEYILHKYEFFVKKRVNCFPKKEIESLKTEENDLLYLHYSGHGIKRGKMINGKAELLSCWINPDNTVVNSYEIDKIISKFNCQIILTSDSCNSETFGKYFTGKNKFIFIGTSGLNRISSSYSINNKPFAGSLTCLYENILEEKKEIEIDIIQKRYKSFFHKNNIKNKLVIKELNF